MAEPLKNHFGPNVVRRIADQIHAVHRVFNRDAFVKDALNGYEDLELLTRGWKIARALRRHLPADYDEAADILLASLGPKSQPVEGQGMAVFIYLPHVYFVAEFGLDHFETSMRLQHELTQRFTAEFSIRAYLERHPKATLARLAEWSRSPSHHVRRLVSEGTRPRLPWAPRLRAFQKDPAPVLKLLERLKDDASLYVRRSVANNLNDIGKDHPKILVDTARRWLKGATAERRWIVRHALRSVVKLGDAAALALLGYGGRTNVRIGGVGILPARPAVGGHVVIAFDVSNRAKTPQKLLVDFKVHFVKSNGSTTAKVFKLKELNLAPGETVHLRKKVTLADLTTRKHFPGLHKVDVQINGSVRPLGSFVLTKRKA